MTQLQEQILHAIYQVYKAQASDSPYFTEGTSSDNFSSLASYQSIESEAAELVTLGHITLHDRSTEPKGLKLTSSGITWVENDVATKATAATSAAATAALQNGKNGSGTNKVLTTDATQTTLYSFTLPSNSLYHIEATVVAVRTGGSAGSPGDSLRCKLSGLFRNVSGTVSLVSTADRDFKRSNTNWDVSASITGDTISCRVTGVANTNITWFIVVNYQQVGI